MDILLKDTAGDFVSSATFGAVDQQTGDYYTLMQPVGTSTIHLAKFVFKTREKTIVPLQSTVAMGHFVDGHIIGIDEDEGGIYFAMVDPTTGNCIQKSMLGAGYSMDVSSIDVDISNHTAYFGLGSSTGGNVFTLFAFSTQTGKQLRDPVIMTPTPDTQGPIGFKYIGEGTILAFMPPIGSPWELISIDSKTGRVSPTTGLEGTSPMRTMGTGNSWLLHQSLPHGGRGPVLHAALSAGLGTPFHMIAIDVVCALTQSVNCSISNTPWPPPLGVGLPGNLGLYSPRHQL